MVFSNFSVMCLNVDFFSFILLRVHSVCFIICGFVVLIRKVLGHYFFRFCFSLILFLLSFWGSNYMYDNHLILSYYLLF